MTDFEPSEYTSLRIRPQNLNNTLHLLSKDDDLIIRKTIAARKLKEAYREIHFPVIVGGVNIVKSRGYSFKENQDTEVYTQYISDTTLEEWLQTRRSYFQKLVMCRGLINGLAGMHSHGIAHRDIKPDNIVVKNDATPMYIDFELATVFDYSLCKPLPSYLEGELDDEKLCGSPNYCCTQVCEKILQTDKYSIVDWAKADVFSLSVVMYYILSNKQLPYAQNSAERVYADKINMNFVPLQTPFENLNNIINSVFTPRLNRRPTLKDLLDEVLICYVPAIRYDSKFSFSI